MWQHISRLTWDLWLSSTNTDIKPGEKHCGLSHSLSQSWHCRCLPAPKLTKSQRCFKTNCSYPAKKPNLIKHRVPTLGLCCYHAVKGHFYLLVKSFLWSTHWEFKVLSMLTSDNFSVLGTRPSRNASSYTSLSYWDREVGVRLGPREPEGLWQQHMLLSPPLHPPCSRREKHF